VLDGDYRNAAEIKADLDKLINGNNILRSYEK
jgi:hypothetical protein